MLATLGLIALLVVFATCRQPNVRFFSVITLWNRKQKLTPLGSKLYLVFSIVLLAGIVLNVVYRTTGNAVSSVQESPTTPQNAEGQSNDASDDPADDAGRPQHALPAPAQYMEVMANVLSYDYQQNEVSADIKYKGKPIRVVGQIDSVNKDAFDNVWIGIATDNEFLPIHATLTKNAEGQAATLQKGLPIAVECIGDGLLVGSPMLDKCTISNQ